jgi:hypothetical protein
MTTNKGFASLNLHEGAYKIVRQIALDKGLTIHETVERALKIAYPVYFQNYDPNNE